MNAGPGLADPTNLHPHPHKAATAPHGSTLRPHLMGRGAETHQVGRSCSPHSQYFSGAPVAAEATSRLTPQT